MLAAPQTTHTPTDAAHAAEKALAAAAAPTSHTKRRHAAEMGRLHDHIQAVRSDSLRNAIQAALPLKQRAYELGELCDHFCRASIDDRRNEEKREASDRSEAAWNAAWRELDVAAAAVAQAPFCGLLDLVARSEAYAEIVGRPDDGAPPDCDEDHIRMLSSIRDGVMQLIARQAEASMPSEWREALATIGSVHYRAPEAVRHAFAKGMNLGNLRAIQLTGRPEDQLPMLMFSDESGSVWWVGPDAAYQGEPAQ